MAAAGDTSFDNHEDETTLFETSPGVEVITTFLQMGIKAEVLGAMHAYGVRKPSAIQQRAVMPIIKGKDVIAQAHSGRGKTYMIVVIVCQMICTTIQQELCAQTVEVILAFSDSSHVQAHACIGSIGEDRRKMECGVHVLSGTPGRICDMIIGGALTTSAIKLLILDEADQMLSMDSKDQIYNLYRYMPPDLQVVLVSATLPQQVLEFINKVTTDPVRILVKYDEPTTEGVLMKMPSSYELRHLYE